MAGLLLAVLAGGNLCAAKLETPEDRELSPYTGYTRSHWLEITEKLIAGVLPYFDQESGALLLEGAATETRHFEMMTRGEWRREAFGRTLMLVAIYTAATGRDRVPGYDGSITKPYLRALVLGTDPANPRRWKPSIPESMLGTNVAMAILLSPKFLWDPLTPARQSNVLDTLERLGKRWAYDNNHWYFHLITVPVLEKYGRPSDRERLTRMFERLLGWYRGDGWFIDGANKGFDYYNLWGFQLYNNALMHFDRTWREVFGGRIRRLTRQFEKSYPYLYGRDGGPVPWGRSLTYRFASNAAVGYALLNDASTLPPGQARRIASGCLRYFWNHGCLSEKGLLEPGYWGPNSAVAEIYIARSSPYWAAQGLIPLVLSADYPFWTAVERPMPADGAGGRVALSGAEMTIRVSPVDGEARVFTVGQPFGHAGHWQRGIKYFQHAYSSYIGFPVVGEGGPDLVVGRTGVSYDGKTWRYRTNPRPIHVGPYGVTSVYDIDLARTNPHLEEFGEVITHTLIGTDGEVHVFWHTSAGPVYMTVAGYDISVAHGGELQESRGDGDLLIGTDWYHSVLQLVDAPAGELAVERVVPRKGWGHAHLFGGDGAFPYWRSKARVPPNRPVIVYVNATRDRPAAAAGIEVSSTKGVLRIRFEGVTREVPIPY